jgi:hypothetical protein
MIKSKKKAQVSVEALILVGIIVLGATIFASMYLNRITHGINSSTKLDAGLSDIFNDPFNNGTSTDINEEPHIDSDIFYITLALDPPSASSINQPFRVGVTLDNNTGISGAKINKVEIYKEALTATNCTLIGETSTTPGTYEVNILFNSSNLKTLEFRCCAAGTYKIKVFAEIPGTEYLTDNITPDKIITSGLSSYAVKIEEPRNDTYLVLGGTSNFKASVTPSPNSGETDHCMWYVNEKPITGSSTPNTCNLENISLSEPLFTLGENEISVFATRYSNGVMINNAESNVKVKIIKMPGANELILFAPRKVFVGDNFNIKVYGLNQSQVENAGRNTSDFSFTTNCEVTSNSSVCGSAMIYATTGTSTIYFCDYPAVCLRAAYDQTSPHNPKDVTVSLAGSTPAKFFSVYDLAYYSGNCNTTATEYGILQSCVMPFTGGLGYNDDYWRDSSYGFLKSYIDQASETNTNNYGKIIGYIS